MSDTESEGADAGDPDRPLPLREACLAWCDSALVAAAMQALAEAAPPRPRLPQAWQGPGHDHRNRLWMQAAKERWGAKDMDLRQRRAEAERALTEDFRARIAAGEIVLTGLRTAPALDREPSTIAPAWALRLRFDWRRSAVSIGTTRYEDVSGARPIPGQGSAAPKPEAPATAEADPAPTDVDADPAVGDVEGPRARGGRPPSDELIEGALRARWDRVVAETAKAGSSRPVFAKLARALSRDLERLHRGSNRKLPQEQTIRRNLPKIYDRLLRETGCGKPIPQN